MLEFVPDGLPTLSLDGGDIVLTALEGTGIPDPVHQTVHVPERDGESIVRTLLDVRFVRAHLALVPDGSLHTVRREFASKLNPKKTLGVLRYQPEEAGPIYEIPAKYNGGLQFGQMIGAYSERAVISFRCPSPAWRATPAQTIAFDVEANGWLVPTSFPLTIGATVGQFVVNNTGDLPTFPIITFIAGAGGAEGPSFQNVTTGKTIAFTNPVLSIPSFGTLTVNMNNGTATLDGSNVIGYRTDESQSWALDEGLNTIRVEVLGGSGQTSLQYNHLLIGV